MTGKKKDCPCLN